MTAGEYNFTLEQGTTFSKNFDWKDDDGNVIDLTGYSAAMQIRECYSDTAVIFTAKTTDVTPNIVITPAIGRISLTIPATTSAAFTFETAVYDIEITISTTVTRLIQGTITLSFEATKV